MSANLVMQGAAAAQAEAAQAAREAAQAAAEAARAASEVGGQSTRDQIRTQIQNAIRDGMRDGRMNAVDEAALERTIEQAVEQAVSHQVVTVEPPMPPWMRQPQVPKGAVDISIAFFVCAAATIIFTPIMRAWARSMDRRGTAATADSPAIGNRLERIEQAVDAIAVEVERLGEGQRYSTKLLGEMRSPAPVGSRDGMTGQR